MKNFIFLLFFCCSNLLGENNLLMRHELMLRVVDADGNPIAKSVKLYQPEDIITPYREGLSENYWRWLLPDVNAVCDVNDNNSGTDVTWSPIVGGSYILRIDDKYVDVYFLTREEITGSFDFIIRYQNETFTIDENRGGLGSMSETKDWKFEMKINQRLDAGLGNHAGTILSFPNSVWKQNRPISGWFSTFHQS